MFVLLDGFGIHPSYPINPELSAFEASSLELE
jgi:hypothetical protein